MKWTLEYDGTTKTLEEWGINGVRLRRVSQAPDELFFSSAEKSTASPRFAHEGKITIRHQTGNNAPVKWFVGWISSIPAMLNGQTERRNYKAQGPWMWFDRLVFQKIWYKAVDPSNPASSVIGGYRGEFILNMGANGVHQTIADQMEELVDFVNQVSTLQGGETLLQLGNCPTTLPPFSDVTDITCAEAVKQLLRWAPHAVTRFDYTTTPPTLHVETNLATVTVAMSDAVIGDVSLTPRYDRQVERVRLKLKQNNSTNGVSWVYDVWDIYPVPPNGNSGTFLAPAVGGGYYYLSNAGQITKSATSPPSGGSPPPPENTFNELMLSLNLVGWTEQWARAYIQSETWGTTNWLHRKLPFLNAPGSTLRSFSLVKLTFQDGTVWNGVSPILAYDIISGAAVDGLRDNSGNPVTAQTYTAVYRVNHASELGSMKQDKKNDLQVVKFNAISVPTGTYSGLQSQVSGDPIPTGLAQSLYEGLSVLQHDGSVRIKRKELSVTALMGKKLTISGGNPEWTGMTIQSVDEEIDSAEVTVSVGVPRHLSAGDMVELLRVSRTRQRYIAPRTVQTGQGSTGASAAIPQHTHGDNSVPGAGIPAVFSMTNATVSPTNGSMDANRIESGLDALNGVFRLVKVGGDAARPDYSQELVKNGSSILLDLAKCKKSTDETGVSLEIREETVCVRIGNSNVNKKRLILCSEPY